MTAVAFTGYSSDANSSQALHVAVSLTGRLEQNARPVVPPSHWAEAQVRARRLSLIMPTPTLVDGRPT